MKITSIGLSLIHHYESCELEAYLDVAGVPTIGWGNTYYENGKPVKLGQIITRERADQLFDNLIGKYEGWVDQLVTVPLKWYQNDALVSFCYNVGPDIDADNIAEGLGDSTLLKKVNAKAPANEITAEFAKWNKSGGKVRRGLTRRRATEATLFNTGKLVFTP